MARSDIYTDDDFDIVSYTSEVSGSGSDDESEPGELSAPIAGDADIADDTELAMNFSTASMGMNFLMPMSEIVNDAVGSDAAAQAEPSPADGGGAEAEVVHELACYPLTSRSKKFSQSRPLSPRIDPFTVPLDYGVTFLESAQMHAAHWLGYAPVLRIVFFGTPTQAVHEYVACLCERLSSVVVCWHDVESGLTYPMPSVSGHNERLAAHAPIECTTRVRIIEGKQDVPRELAVVSSDLEIRVLTADEEDSWHGMKESFHARFLAQQPDVQGARSLLLSCSNDRHLKSRFTSFETEEQRFVKLLWSAFKWTALIATLVFLGMCLFQGALVFGKTLVNGNPLDASTRISYGITPGSIANGYPKGGIPNGAPTGGDSKSYYVDLAAVPTTPFYKIPRGDLVPVRDLHREVKGYLEPAAIKLAAIIAEGTRKIRAVFESTGEVLGEWAHRAVQVSRDGIAHGLEKYAAEVRERTADSVEFVKSYDYADAWSRVKDSDAWTRAKDLDAWSRGKGAAVWTRVRDASHDGDWVGKGQRAACGVRSRFEQFAQRVEERYRRMNGQ